MARGHAWEIEVPNGKTIPCPNCGERASVFMKQYGVRGICLDCYDKRQKAATAQWSRSHAEEVEDLTEAQTRALIEEYLKYSTFYRWDHLFEYGGSNALPFLGIRTINSATNKKRGMGLFLDTIAGVNKIWEAGMGFNSIIPINQGLDWHASVWSPFYFSMRLNRSNPVGVTAGEKFQGIGWGDMMGIDTPWATNYVSYAGYCTTQLRFNYTTEKWELMWFVGGTAPTVIECDVQPAFSVDLTFAECALEWDGRTINAYIDRVLVSSVDTDPDNSGFGWSSNTGNGPYFFWTNGSGAGSSCSEGGFYQGHVFQPMNLPGSPATE